MTVIGTDQSTSNQIYWVSDNVIASDFPPVSSALRDPDGLLAIGGELSPATLLNAYKKGIFPWYSAGQPILWWSPNPRCVLNPKDFKISRSLRKTLRKNHFRVSFNKAFSDVVTACSKARKDSDETWITDDMKNAYIQLHELHKAVSVECWLDNRLVGGLYGVVIDRVYFGESMFSRESDASKVAMVHLVQTLKEMQFRIIDCQVYSKHLQTLGAKPVAREMFVNILKHYCRQETHYDWPVGMLKS